jgi:hypothetical protein
MFDLSLRFHFIFQKGGSAHTILFFEKDAMSTLPKALFLYDWDFILNFMETTLPSYFVMLLVLFERSRRLVSVFIQRRMLTENLQSVCMHGVFSWCTTTDTRQYEILRENSGI